MNDKEECTKSLWDFGVVYEAEIMSWMACGDNGHTGYEEVTGQTPDISEWLDFESMISFGGSITLSNQILQMMSGNWLDGRCFTSCWL